LIHRSTAAIRRPRKDFLAGPRVFLTGRSFRPAAGSSTVAPVIAPRAAIASVIIAARWTLWLGLRQLAGKRCPTGKAHLSVWSHLCDHDRDLISDAEYVLDPIDTYRWVLGELGDMDEAVLAGKDLDKRAVRHDADDLAVVDLAALNAKLLGEA
jgi:hypothetical protein